MDFEHHKLGRKPELKKILWSSLFKHPLLLAKDGLIGFSVLWTVTAWSNNFIGSDFFKSRTWCVVCLLFTIAYTLYAQSRLSKADIQIPLSNVCISIEFGDIFACDGITVIPVNEFFDNELGLPVSPKSLHGIFINKCFGGYSDSLDKQIDEQLRNIESTVLPKEKGKTTRYPIGTTVSVSTSEKKFFLFAFTHTDLKTCKASADVPQLFEALGGLWKYARNNSNGDTLNIPLVGSNLSGVGLPSKDLLNLILHSFVDETKKQVVVQRMRIVLTPDRAEEVNIGEVKKSWETK